MDGTTDTASCIDSETKLTVRALQAFTVFEVFWVWTDLIDPEPSSDDLHLDISPIYVLWAI